MYLGTNIQYYRALRGWNDTELAARAHLDRVSIGRIVRGHQQPSLHTIQVLAEVLGVEVYQLFLPPGRMPPTRMSRPVDTLIQLVIQLPPCVLDSLIRHVETLLQYPPRAAAVPLT